RTMLIVVALPAQLSSPATIGASFELAVEYLNVRFPPIDAPPAPVLASLFWIVAYLVPRLSGVNRPPPMPTPFVELTSFPEMTLSCSEMPSAAYTAPPRASPSTEAAMQYLAR